MKKRICSLVAVFLLILSMTVSAADSRASALSPSLTFDGTTATCAIDISGNTMSDSIKATVKLYHGSTCLKTWTDSGTGYLFFSETYSKNIEVGQKYKMTVDYTIAGKSYPQLSASATCR